MNKAIRVIYTIFIGVLFAIFVGVGIAAFYEGPKPPNYPSELSYPMTKDKSAAEDRKNLEMQKEYDEKQKLFEKEIRIYNRNVSVISIVASIIVLMLSLVLIKKILLIADGLLIGGVLTLIYSIIRGFDTEGNMFRFLIVTVGLIASLVIGYVKFIKPTETSI